MSAYEDKIKQFQLIQKSQLNSTIAGTKEYFVKTLVDELIEEGFSGDELLNKAKEKLSGGNWVTINGNHVYIKDGKVEAGAIHTGDEKDSKVTPGENIKKESKRSEDKEKEKTREEKVKELVSRLKGKNPKDKTPEAIRDIKKQLSELKLGNNDSQNKETPSLKSKLKSVPALGTYSYDKNDLKK